MSRSFKTMRWALLSLSSVITLGFGATEALSRPATAAALPRCPARDYEYVYQPCNQACYGWAFCNTSGYCQCGPLP